MKAVIYRILGNDLPPRHHKGQTLRNTQFILDNEPELADATKIWIINRIVDADEERKLVLLLDKHHQEYLHIPFNAHDYHKAIRAMERPKPFYNLLKAKRKRRQLKVLYVMNVNGARNVALQDGKARADWIFPLDGNTCFTLEGWFATVERLNGAKDLNRYFAIPMYRLLSNEQYRSFNPVDFPQHEPQMVFGRDTQEQFHPDFSYGKNSKIEMLKRVGIQLGCNTLSFHATSSEQIAGYVVRLFSGEAKGESDFTRRSQLRKRGVDAMLRCVDRKVYGVPWKRILRYGITS